ncbi:hypothetical protein ABWH92_12430 [Ahrensia marina]|uniref:hypothetical protein n=1 Tax=Ahrensia marina TaxID=1514904 RepID=UPI0035D0433E
MPAAAAALVPLFVSGGSLTFLGQAAVGIGLSLASAALQSVLSPKRRAQSGEASKFEVRNTVNATSQPEFRVYGRDLVGGQLFFYANLDGTLHVGVIVGSGTIDRFEAIRLYGQEVLLDSSGFVTSPPYTESGRRLVQFEFRQGFLDDPVSAILFNAFDEWTADHKLSGLPYYVGAFTQSSQSNFQKIYQGRQPDPQAIIRGATCFDNRQAGHDFLDGDTWEFTQNPAVGARDYITSLRGRGQSRDLIDNEDFDGAADYCDATRTTLKGAGQKAFTFGGEYLVNDPPQDVLATILGTFGGDLYLKPNGKYGLHYGPITETPFEITTDMIIERFIEDGAPIFEAYNALDVFYTSPEHEFSKQPAGRVERADLVAKRGKQVVQEFYNDMVQDADQALRLAYKRLYDDQPDFVGEAILNHRGLGVLYDDNLSRRRLATIPNRIKDTVETIEILSYDLAADLSTVRLRFRAHHPEKHTFVPANEGFTQPEVPPLLSQGPGFPPSANNLTGISVVVDNDPNPDAITVALIWDQETNNVASQIVQWREAGQPEWNTVGSVASDQSVVILANPVGIVAADTMEFRVNRYSSDGYQSGFVTESFVVANATMGTAGVQSVSGTGQIEAIQYTIQQADEATAIAVEFLVSTSAIISDWSGATRVEVSRGGFVRGTLDAAQGSTNIHARVVYVDGTFSVGASANVTVAPAPVTDTGSAGDGGNNSGSDSDNNAGTNTVDSGSVGSGNAGSLY